MYFETASEGKHHTIKHNAANKNQKKIKENKKTWKRILNIWDISKYDYINYIYADTVRKIQIPIEQNNA